MALGLFFLFPLVSLSIPTKKGGVFFHLFWERPNVVRCWSVGLALSGGFAAIPRVANHMQTWLSSEAGRKAARVPQLGAGNGTGAQGVITATTQDPPTSRLRKQPLLTS